jgi:hypothetical protein
MISLKFEAIFIFSFVTKGCELDKLYWAMQLFKDSGFIWVYDTLTLEEGWSFGEK